ncbi:MAG: YjgN family protein [Steroidobacteraceae bacterium]
MEEQSTTGAAADAAAPASTAATRNIPFEFRATGGEYFRIWIVNLLLTIVTLGIYSAWAKVRRLRYFYGSTLLDGASFEYHGRPIAILKGRLIVVGAYMIFLLVSHFLPLITFIIIPLFIFAVPWIVQRSRLFQMRMSSWRGLRFNFTGTYGGAMGAYVGWAIVAAITLYVLVPIWLWKRVNYLLSNSSYGGERFRFTTPIGRYFGFYFKTIGLMLLLGILAGILVGAAAAGAGKPAVEPGNPYSIFMHAPVMLAFIILGVLGLGIAGYYQKSFINASFGGLEIGNHKVRSELRAWPLIGIYVSNFLLIVLTLGLFYPWAKVRQMRYQLDNTSIDAQGGFDEFRAGAEADASAVGEEVGDFFDVDFGL